MITSTTFIKYTCVLVSSPVVPTFSRASFPLSSPLFYYCFFSLYLLSCHLFLPSHPHSCSLQPEPEWHRPPDVPRGHDITAGGRGGACGCWGCAAGRRQPKLPGHQPPHVPAPFATAPLCFRVWAVSGKNWSNSTLHSFSGGLTKPNSSQILQHLLISSVD